MVLSPDPNLFHLDWERTFEVLGAIVVLSMFVERALALVFEQKLFVKRFGGSPIKEIIAFAVSLVVCLKWQFDALSMTILSSRVSVIGQVVTAAIIAGGSKGSIKLFRDVLGWKSSAYADYEAAKRAEAPARIAQLRARMAEPQPSKPTQ
ncbi:MAG TPA: hypothetical protein VMT19_03775 [Thermoanaerobaculaceae bacterium]|nr:hypothetical protein [Thermoanaerobaculaceae bacterium]